MGDVIDDIAAMATADVAIGLAEDENGFITKTVCDVILGRCFVAFASFCFEPSICPSQSLLANLIVGSSVVLLLLLPRCLIANDILFNGSSDCRNQYVTIS